MGRTSQTGRTGRTVAEPGAVLVHWIFLVGYWIFCSSPLLLPASPSLNNLLTSRRASIIFHPILKCCIRFFLNPERSSVAICKYSKRPGRLLYCPGGFRASRSEPNLNLLRFYARWCNGNTSAFGAEFRGSSPRRAVIITECYRCLLNNRSTLMMTSPAPCSPASSVTIFCLHPDDYRGCFAILTLLAGRPRNIMEFKTY